MSRHLWREARAIFEEAIGLTAAERPALLEQRCGGDAELLAAVETLLEVDAAADHPLDTPPAQEIADLVSEHQDQAWIGRQLGPYRVLEKIGSGGMGSVFLAERADQEYEQRVAIKTLRAGWLAEDSVARFRRERQILARLEHPNIARLLDGGHTEQGLPYLVMEHVEGVSIHEYVQQQRLTVRERVELLRKVIGAVRFAHQNLIVHRDLKAGNVLVTPDGEPKLLDFGIAKLLTDDAPAPPSSTRILTPSYASPEQAAGGQVTTASDVYSLGVLLYELLTGRRPISWQGSSAAEIERRLREVTPETPSRAVQGLEQPAVLAAWRASSPAAVARQLSGDLDTITLKALRKRPENRYSSAEAFGEDLGRWLNGLPVSARPASMGYRLRKFVGRHRIAVAAASVAALALVALISSLWFAADRIARERDLARFEQENAEEIASLMIGIFQWADPETNLGREPSIHEILEIGERRVRESFLGQPRLKAELLATLAEVRSHLGRYEDAAKLADESLGLLDDEAPRGAPAKASTLHLRAEIHYLARELDAAQSAARSALELWSSPDSVGARASTHLLGRIITSKGEQDERPRLGLDIHQGALRRFEASGAPPDAVYRDGLRGEAQAFRRLGLFEEAEVSTRRALQVQLGLHPGVHPETVSLMRELTSRQRAIGKLEEALETGTQAMQLTSDLYGPDHPATADAHERLANVHRRLGDPEAARVEFAAALAIYRKVLGDGHPAVASALSNLATMLVHDVGRADEAEPFAAEALEIRKAHYGDPSGSVAFARVLYADVLVALGRATEALAEARSARAIFRDLSNKPDLDWNVAMAESSLGHALTALGRWDDAEASLERAQELLDALRGPEDLLSVRCARRRLALFEKRGDTDEAAAVRRRLEEAG